MAKRTLSREVKLKAVRRLQAGESAAEMSPDGVNQLWVSDITYIHLAAGFIYLAVILDAFSRRVVG